MPIQYTGVLEEHRGLSGARGRVRRVAPRLGAGARRRRVRHAAVGVHQRPRPHRARAGAVHAPARSGRRARRRRHHRVVGGAGRVPRDAERVEHRAARRHARGRRRGPRGGECTVVDITSTPCRARGAGPRGRERLATVAPDAAAVPRFAVQAVDVRRRRPGWVAGTGYTGEDGVELHVPAAAAAAGAGARSLAAGITPGRARAPATRCGSKPGCRCTATSSARGSPRCRPGWAGWCASTRATSAAAAALEAEHERGVARRLRGLVGRGPPDPAGGLPGARATACRSAR